MLDQVCLSKLPAEENHDNSNGKIRQGSELLEIRTVIIQSFNKYDIGKKGLSDEDFMNFVNQTRKSLYLSNVDEDMKREFLEILDPEKGNRITEERLYSNFARVIKLIGKPGKHTEKLIKKIFGDFDQKKVGFLTIGDLRIVFGLICDMMQVNRQQEWELDYQLNLIDDDGNKTIDPEEFIDNYLFIAQHLMKNERLKDTNPRNLFAELVKCSSAHYEEYFIDGLLEKFNSIKKKVITCGNDESEVDHDDVFKKNRKTAVEILPITKLIEKTVVQRNQKALCENCKKDLKRKSMALEDIKPMPQRKLNKRNSMIEMGAIISKPLIALQDIKASFGMQNPDRKKAEFNKKDCVEDESLLKILEEKIEQIFVAPYMKVNSGQLKSVASINNIMANRSIANLYKIEEESDHIRENAKDGYEDGIDIETEEKTFQRMKKRAKILKLLNNGVSEVTKPSPTNNHLRVDNLSNSMPLFSMSYFPNTAAKAPVASRNYSIFEQLAFFREIRNDPGEISILFDELELTDTSTIFSQIELLQDCFSKSLDNMYKFTEQSISYVIERLQTEGDTKKAQEWQSKLNTKIQYRSNTSLTNQNLPPQTTSFVIPSYGRRAKLDFEVDAKPSLLDDIDNYESISPEKSNQHDNIVPMKNKLIKGGKNSSQNIQFDKGNNSPTIPFQICNLVAPPLKKNLLQKSQSSRNVQFPFAKSNYLLKEDNIDYNQQNEVNDQTNQIIFPMNNKTSCKNSKTKNIVTPFKLYELERDKKNYKNLQKLQKREISANFLQENQTPKNVKRQDDILIDTIKKYNTGQLQDIIQDKKGESATNMFSVSMITLPNYKGGKLAKNTAKEKNNIKKRGNSSDGQHEPLPVIHPILNTGKMIKKDSSENPRKVFMVKKNGSLQNGFENNTPKVNHNHLLVEDGHDVKKVGNSIFSNVNNGSMSVDVKKRRL